MTAWPAHSIGIHPRARRWTLAGAFVLASFGIGACSDSPLIADFLSFVGVLQLDGVDFPNATLSFVGSGGTYAGTTDGQGQFRVELPSAGTYAVRVAGVPAAACPDGNVDARAGEVRLDVRCYSLDGPVQILFTDEGNTCGSGAWQPVTVPFTVMKGAVSGEQAQIGFVAPDGFTVMGEWNAATRSFNGSASAVAPNGLTVTESWTLQLIYEVTSGTAVLRGSAVKDWVQCIERAAVEVSLGTA
ncbi:MAG: hypothetical protein R3E10_15855 [Gemmatimonadota bacterium]